jgi:hypothetical protein
MSSWRLTTGDSVPRLAGFSEALELVDRAALELTERPARADLQDQQQPKRFLGPSVRLRLLRAVRLGVLIVLPLIHLA